MMSHLFLNVEETVSVILFGIHHAPAASEPD